MTRRRLHVLTPVLWALMVSCTSAHQDAPPSVAASISISTPGQPRSLTTYPVLQPGAGPRYEDTDAVGRVRALAAGGVILTDGNGDSVTVAGGGDRLRLWVQSQGGVVPLDALRPLSDSPGNLSEGAASTAGRHRASSEPLALSEPFAAGGQEMAAAVFDPCEVDCEDQPNWKPLYESAAFSGLGSKVPELEGCAVVLRFLICPAPAARGPWLLREQVAGHTNVFVISETRDLPDYSNPGRCRFGALGEAALSGADRAVEVCLSHIAAQGGY